MKVTVRAKPGSRRTSVSVADEGTLVVAVTARAVDGAANTAVQRALAEALGLRRSRVELVRGHRARTKTYEVDAPETDVRAAIRRLSP